jgi:ubiquinone/menaquinone biosynthesis C-methylase UbiE
VTASGSGSPLAGPSDPPRDRSGDSKGYRGLAMEGSIARWYARTRGSESQIALWRRQAHELTQGLRDHAEVLEVAPGPGYFAIELARLGRCEVTGLDISHTFIEIAAQNARRAGVRLALRHGDASRMPFGDESFDLVVCQAAFKNFSRPQSAVNEMHRVLRVGGTARIEDMRHDASDAAIRDEVAAMNLTALRAFMTRRALTSLRRRAYTVEQFAAFAQASPFGGAEVRTGGIGLEVCMTKRARGPNAAERTRVPPSA